MQQLVTTDTTRLLEQVLDGLKGPDLEMLSQVVERRRVPSETVICREGEIGHEFYIIRAGTVVISKRFEDEHEHVLAVKGAGEFFGEIALIEDKPRTATVTAMVDVAEGPRMITNIVECNPEEVKNGMELEVVFQERTPEFTLPQFRPVKK